MRFQLTTAKYRFAAALYLFLVYAFGVFSKSAWSDDFSALFDPDAVALHAIRDSRIVYGWLVDLLFGQFTTIQSLAFIKLLGLLGLILLNDLLINNLLKIKMSVGVDDFLEPGRDVAITSRQQGCPLSIPKLALKVLHLWACLADHLFFLIYSRKSSTNVLSPASTHCFSVW